MILVPLILGLVSSLHCVGMCGPIALMIPNAFGPQQATVFQRLQSIVLYNLGRTTTYMIYGLAVGMIGKSVSWFGWQQQLSVALGVSILVTLALVYAGGGAWSGALTSAVFGRIRGWFGWLLGKRNAASLFGIGLLNGVLPCGMVYLALAGAWATGSAVEGVLFMGLFGVGTIPAMAVLSYFGSMVSLEVRKRTRALFPVMMGLMAALLIVRGLNLGIPFLSPEAPASASQTVSCH
jgi:uncharacterized protein